jgi:hypothetical protein
MISQTLWSIFLEFRTYPSEKLKQDSTIYSKYYFFFSLFAICTRNGRFQSEFVKHSQRILEFKWKEVDDESKI